MVCRLRCSKSLASFVEPDPPRPNHSLSLSISSFTKMMRLMGKKQRGDEELMSELKQKSILFAASVFCIRMIAVAVRNQWIKA